MHETMSLRTANRRTEPGEVLIRVENIGKKYCRDLRKSLRYGARDALAELLPWRSARADDGGSLRPGEFWALQDVSFELRRGECLGLIGRNGAGKTTLLKILNGLIRPDRGRAEIRGRVGALIALGAGFNPVLTGRENIYVNASVLGLTRRETDAKFDEIVEFSGLEAFLDTPVQNYSSGMQVRLGFAIAASLEPDVLLVDEVLAVGDLGFRQKAYNRIYEIMDRAAVVFVSHSIAQVTKVCTRALHLSGGRVAAAGGHLPEVLDSYFREFPAPPPRPGGHDLGRVLDFRAYEDGPETPAAEAGSVADGQQARAVLRHGRPAIFELSLALDPSIAGFDVIFSIFSMEMQMVAQCSSMNCGAVLRNQGPVSRVSLRLPQLLLNDGRYTVTLTVIEPDRQGRARGRTLAFVENLADLRVSAERALHGAAPVQLVGTWEAGVPLS